MAKEKLKRTVWEKTEHHCHICGRLLIWENYGKKGYGAEGWHLDHVFPKSKGGHGMAPNFLPACGECNVLRWNRTGEGVRAVLRHGIVALKESQNGTPLGLLIRQRMAKREKTNAKRRKTK